MTHFSTHERDAFLAWVTDGFPEQATIEEHYQERQVTADELLRRFMLPDLCTDTMPWSECEDVAAQLGYTGDARGMSYGLAACALLADRAAGRGAGEAFLERAFEESASTATDNYSTRKQETGKRTVHPKVENSSPQAVYVTAAGETTLSAHVAAARNHVHVCKLAAAGLTYEEIEQQTGIPAATAQQWVASE